MGPTRVATKEYDPRAVVRSGELVSPTRTPADQSIKHSFMVRADQLGR
ncbi:MAG: hypothetical protein M0P09_09085 [Acholeplasmataceae bacterium]|nr:hypothetical protein [Acholeplasmataceae bacterium]